MTLSKIARVIEVAYVTKVLHIVKVSWTYQR